MKPFTHKECIFVLLVQIPDEGVYQVSATQDQLKDFIASLGEFKVIDRKFETITLEKK